MNKFLEFVRETYKFLKDADASDKFLYAIILAVLTIFLTTSTLWAFILAVFSVWGCIYLISRRENLRHTHAENMQKIEISKLEIDLERFRIKCQLDLDSSDNVRPTAGSGNPPPLPERSANAHLPSRKEPRIGFKTATPKADLEEGS